uniref:Endonuclease/exonuclease/phosphatase domain-containing protein n=1 Tax=Glossina morsitans morsitans TaxID=37546 RepID=A0A1B0GB77_GLOMM
MRFMQINLNHGEAAHDLLRETVVEKELDVVLLSEPYRRAGQGTWVTDLSKKAAIWAPAPIALLNVDCQHRGFVRATVKYLCCYSCYAPPSSTQGEFQRMLDELVEDVPEKTAVIIAGDFNAWAFEWGSKPCNARGRGLLEAFAVVKDIGVQHLLTTPYIFRENPTLKINHTVKTVTAQQCNEEHAIFILEHPDLIRGKSLLDVENGCGATSIAALKKNAKHAIANDVDEGDQVLRF